MRFVVCIIPYKCGLSSEADIGELSLSGCCWAAVSSTLIEPSQGDLRMNELKKHKQQQQQQIPLEQYLKP